jgi:hypothetical protein
MSKLTVKISDLNIEPVAQSFIFERKDKIKLFNKINETNEVTAKDFSENPSEEKLKAISLDSTVSCVVLLETLSVANDEGSLLR